MVIELKRGYTVDSWYDKFTDSYITRLLDPEGNQIRDALYSGDIVGRNYDIQAIKDFFITYMKDPNFNVEPTEESEEVEETSEETFEEEEPIEEALDPELEKKARRTKVATRKTKLPALSKMTPIMPDYAAGMDKFNAATADGNSGMASTTGSTGLGEAYIGRSELIRALKRMGFKYKFDKYSDKQLYRIYQERLAKLEKKKAQEKIQQQEDAYRNHKGENAKDSYFKNGIEFESEDAAREYFGESMEKKFYLNDMHEAWDIVEDEPKQPLKESAENKGNGFKTIQEGLHFFEAKHFDENCEDAELEVMYESVKNKLSSEDIRRLGAFMNRAKDTDEVITYMRGLLTKDQKLQNESLEEEID